MLRRMLLPFAALSLALTVSSCGPSYRPIQVRATTEAEYLQAEAAAINLQGQEIVDAEGYLAQAKKTENVAESAAYADLAAAYYRVALADNAVKVSEQALSASKAAYGKSIEQVDTYSKVLISVSSNAGGAK